MVMKLLRIYILILVGLAFQLHPQSSSLHVTYERFGKLKRFEVFTYETLEYKLKGDLFYRKNKIVNMRDSFIVFSNDSVLRLDQIKGIRLNKNIAEVKQLRKFFIALGIAFFSLNTVNNIITDSPPIVDGVAASVSAGLITVSFLIKQLEIKRIRITKNKTLKVVSINYQDLNEKN
jgi:hypothetical protein